MSSQDPQARKAYRERIRAEGLCRDCLQKRDGESTSRCTSCLEKHRIEQRLGGTYRPWARNGKGRQNLPHSAAQSTLQSERPNDATPCANSADV